MVKKVILFFFLFSIALNLVFAQEIIEVPFETNAAVKWEGNEKSFFSKNWDTPVVTNVSVPTMQAFLPTKPNGTSVIIAPGGGLYALSIESEGTAVAQWLSERGVTAFVLKYRLVPTGENGVKELEEDATNNPIRLKERLSPVMPLSIADALSAIGYVREKAATYKVDPNKIGFMGFSAGGAVTMGTAYNYTKENRPDFVVPVYPWTTAYPVQEVPVNAPPMMVICASDDPLGLASGSIDLYTSWLNANKPVALQMFSKGGHGFGMKKQNLPSDNWIQHFYDWAVSEKIIVEVK